MRLRDIIDVVVIGSGPSGIMAAIAAAQQGAKTLLLEKGDRPGRKLLISGGGRCNVTNARGTYHIIENTPGNGRFLHSVFAQWSNESIIDFFTSRGVALKEEDRGRMFPVSNKAKTVLDALRREMVALDVQESYGEEVVEIEQTKTHWNVVTRNRKIQTHALVIATGGCSVPQTGSTGDGYRFARGIGHTLVAPYPTSVPLTSEDSFITQGKLQGLAFRDCVLTLFDPKGKKVTKEQGDLLVTHFGLSGPVALRISQYVVKTMAKFPQERFLPIVVDTNPTLNQEERFAFWQSAFLSSARKAIRNILREHLPDRFGELFLSEYSLDPYLEGAQVSQKMLKQLVAWEKEWPVQVTGTLGLEKATVTGGGIHLKEIEPTTLASKITLGCYFCGEVLDLHAHTGGYNITVAFSTGYVAGRHAAEYALYQPLG